MSEINKLANYIMAEIDGEPSQSEGAGTCAIRIIKQLRTKLAEANERIKTACKQIADNHVEYQADLTAKNKELESLNIMVSNQSEMDKLMLAKDKRREELEGALEKAGSMLRHIDCPQCDGSGGFYDNNGNACQCQWCFEKSVIEQALNPKDNQCQ